MKVMLLNLMILMIAFPLFAQVSITLSRPQKGIIADITEIVLREAYKSIDIPIKVMRIPAERALIIANDGKVDGVLNRIKGIESKYPNLVRIPVAIAVVEGVVFTKDITFDVAGWKSLKPYRIGIRKGIKFIEKGTKGMRVQPVTKEIQNFLKLDLGRIDLVVTGRLGGLAIIREIPLQGINILEPPLATLELYHYLIKKHESLFPKITQVLREMETTDRIKEIRNQVIKEFSETPR